MYIIRAIGIDMVYLQVCESSGLLAPSPLGDSRFSRIREPSACTPPPMKLPRSRAAAQHGFLSIFRSIFRKIISTGFWPDSTVAATGNTRFRSCQRCWNVYAHGGKVWGPTGHHPAALGGPIWPARQHPNDPVCTEAEGGRQAGVRRHGAGWPLLAASAHSYDLCE